MFFESLETRRQFSSAGIPINPPPPNLPPLPNIHRPSPGKMITGAYDGTNNGQTATGRPSKPK